MFKFTRLTAVFLITTISSVYSLALVLSNGLVTEVMGWIISSLVLLYLFLNMLSDIKYRVDRQESELSMLKLYVIYFNWTERLLKDNVDQEEKRYYFNLYLDMKKDSDRLVDYAERNYGLEYTNAYLLEKHLFSSNILEHNKRTEA